MVKKEFIVIKNFLQRLLEQKNISVDKVIFFGSYARGEEKETSDIDIIVVSRSFRNKDIFKRVELASGVHRELVKKIMRPVDIIYYSDVEWKKGKSLIISAAKQKGEVIYA